MEQLTPLINALKRYWKADLRRLTFLAALVMALVTARTTSGPRLALSLGSIASPDPRSAYRRFQRFLAWPGLDGRAMPASSSPSSDPKGSSWSWTGPSGSWGRARSTS